MSKKSDFIRCEEKRNQYFIVDNIGLSIKGSDQNVIALVFVNPHIWAKRRDMGPVTVFFVLITAWLLSGTVFSATSLAERGDFEVCYAYWQ